MNANKPRNARLDLARVVFMIFVIGIHTPLPFIDSYPTFRTYFYTILFSADAAFFTLSGYFLLQKKFESISDYKAYYFSRAVSILLPIFIFHFVLDVLFHRFIFQIGLKAYVKSYFLNILSNDYGGHLWFLYIYIPLVVFAPLMSKALNALSKKDLILILCLAAGWRLLEWSFAKAGISYFFGNRLLAHWTIYFIFGHYLWRFAEELKKYRFVFYGLGIIGLVLVKLNSTIDTHPASLLDRPYYMMFIIATFVLLLHQIPVEKLNYTPKVLTFIAKHSFTVYLTHLETIDHVTNLLNKIYNKIHYTPTGVLEGVIHLVLNIVASIVFATLFDELILFRLQNLMKKRAKKN